jgi:hypothetical protein
VLEYYSWSFLYTRSTIMTHETRDKPKSSSFDNLSRGNYGALANHGLNIEESATIDPHLYPSLESIRSSQV